jgi:HSP20 family protein
MEQREIKKRETTDVRTEEEDTARFIRPRTSVFEYDDSVKLIMDMPGVSRENLEINYNRGELSISGKREGWDKDNMKACYCERFEGGFKRIFSLDDTLDPEKIEAKISNGVLELNIPKMEAVKPRKIEIKTQ